MSKRSLKPVDLNLDEPGKDLSRMFAASLSPTAGPRQSGRAVQPSMLAVEQLLDNPYQPRLRMDEASLEEFARVIDGQGFQGVLAARPHPQRPGFYQLTAGHRRREAARRAGLLTLPVVVQELSNEEMVTLAITENIQRDDLTPLEEGRIYLLMNDEMGYTLEQIAREVGKTVGYIYNRLRVAKAPDDIQALVQAKPDSLRAVANLIKVEDRAERAQIIGQLLEGRLTTDDLPSYVKTLRSEQQSASTASFAPAIHPTLSPVPQVSSTVYAAPDAVVAPDTIRLDPDAVDDRVSIEQAHVDVVLVDGVQMPVDHRRLAHDTGVVGVADRADREERARVRARRSRVSRMLGLILTFSDGLREGETIGEEEKLELATIAVVADRLCERFGIKKDG